MIVEEMHFDNRLVKVFVDRPRNLTELLERNERAFANKEALVSGSKRLTYQEFAEQVKNLAGNLSAGWKINRGDRFAILLNNSLEFCLILFALARLGAIAVPLNTRLKAVEWEYMLNNSGSRLLITESVHWEELASVKAQLESIETVFVVGSLIPERTMPFEILLLSDSGSPRVDVPEDDVAMIMYTSGTTGRPKGAMITHLGMIHSVINYQQVFGTKPDERTLVVVPLFHVTGLIGQLIHILYVGGTVILMEAYKTEPMLQLMDQERITFTFVVPTIYILMLLNPNLDSYKLSAWRLAAYGGAPMSEDTVQKLSEKFSGLRLHNAYGATETSSPATLLPQGEHMRKVASVGLPVPVGECMVMADGQKVECNQAGELWIKGPHVVPGYWNNPEANSKEFSGGFWHSGDIAKIDEEGYVYILDRKKDMINRGGEKVFCVEVENVLYSHPNIMEAAVVGVPDQVFGEQVKAVVVLKPDVVLSVDEVREFVAGKLADYKVPKYVEFSEALPRNPGGKVIKGMLRYQND